MNKKRFTAFVVALCLFISIPFTAFAKTVQYESGKIQFVAYSTGKIESQNGTIPFHFIASDMKQTSMQYCDLIFTEEFNLQKNEQLTFNITLGAKRYKTMYATAFVFADNGEFRFSLDYSYSDSQTLSGSIMADKDYNGCRVTIRCNTFGYGDYDEANKLNAYMEVLGASYSIDSEESGFFENVGQWFKELFQKIKDLSASISNGFSSIVSSVGDWFSSLVDDLQQWFSELGTKLQQWFDDVGQWFRDLSDNIKQWFIDLGDKFQKWIDDFKLSFTDWWNDIKEWFKNLFIPEDGYFENFVQTFGNWFMEHFGALYQTVEIISDIIRKLFESFGTTIDYIEYPTIEVPVVNITILEHGRFYWSTITDNSNFAFVFRTFQTVCSAIMIFAVIHFARKTLNQILGIEED